VLQPGHLRLTFDCVTNSILQASSNLVNWVPVQTNYVSALATFEYHDFDVGAYPVRFYRVVLPY
jgi:hypothetical protein